MMMTTVYYLIACLLILAAVAGWVICIMRLVEGMSTAEIMLTELRNVLQRVNDSAYDQNGWPLPGGPCGCAGFHYQQAHNVDKYRLTKPSYWGLTVHEWHYLFGSPWHVINSARQLGAPETSMTRKGAIIRINYLINQYKTL